MKKHLLAITIPLLLAYCLLAACNTAKEKEEQKMGNGVVASGNYRNLFKELLDKTDSEIDAKIDSAWNHLFYGTSNQKVYYEAGDGMAYILNPGHNDIRSEGISYGMMICVQLDKKAEFDALWKWAKTYMYHTSGQYKGYFAWQCETSGAKMDNGPAPDGEEFFVTALLFAAARWNNGEGIFNYGREARQILYDMINRDTGTAPPLFDPLEKMIKFSPYVSYTDPSYHLPAFYEIWTKEIVRGSGYWNDIWGSEEAAMKDANFYKDAAQISRSFLKKTTHPETGLGPYLAEYDGTPRAGLNGNGAVEFDHDAWRIAANIGMDYSWWRVDPWQMEFADKIQAFFYSKGIYTYGSKWTLDGSTVINNYNDLGLIACNAAASLASTTHARAFVKQLWDAPFPTGKWRYYNGCLMMMGLLHCSGNYKAWLD